MEVQVEAELDSVEVSNQLGQVSIKDYIKLLLQNKKLYKLLIKILIEFTKNKIGKDGDLYLEMENSIITI